MQRQRRYIVDGLYSHEGCICALGGSPPGTGLCWEYRGGEEWVWSHRPPNWPLPLALAHQDTIGGEREREMEGGREKLNYAMSKFELLLTRC